MADLISAIAALLWPLLVIVVLLVFGRQLLSKLRNSDDVTLEIGGQRLNFKQATDQQSDMITDLQREVASLKARLVDLEVTGGASLRLRPTDLRPYESSEGGVDNGWTGPFATPDEVVPEGTADESDRVPESVPWSGTGPERPNHPDRRTSHSILWVDDHPENNAVLADSWRRDGAHVETARSTSEALHLLETQAYGLIISDMGRRESGTDVPDAGLRLLAKVRASDPVTPFVLYGNVGPFSDPARAAGATLVTGSTFELMEFASGLGMLDGA
ncbi:response regulator [Promicromonospora sp. NPDC023987]|uniref:response regulator n=1 Tax=Promicromonospora sp. NPDC023987 TaxID=3155360 RepID=UPI0034061241